MKLRSLKFSKFRESVLSKYNQRLGISDTLLNDLIKIGWASPAQLDAKQAEVDGDFWVHSNCAVWSLEVLNNSNLVSLEKVDRFKDEFIKLF